MKTRKMMGKGLVMLMIVFIISMTNIMDAKAVILNVSGSGTDGFWQYDYVKGLDNEKQAIITRYTGFVGETLKIPEKVNGIKVSSIGERCFEGNDKIKTVVIPKSVNTIYSSAFEGCTNLTTIGGNGLKNVSYIGRKAFLGCVELKKVDGLENVSEIGEEAFAGCKVESIKVNTDINAGTFKNCKELSKVTLGKKVRIIDKEAFMDCLALETIDIPENVNAIGYNAFRRTGLKNIKLHYGLVKIGDYAFYGTQFEKINIPNSVEYLGVACLETESPAFNSVIIPSSAQYLHDSRYSIANIAGGYVSVNSYFGLKEEAVVKCYEGSKFAEDVYKCEVLPKVPSKKITFADKDIYINPNEWKKINFSIAPSKTTDAITWTSSAPEIVSVNAGGKVFANSNEGKATILAVTESGKQATVNVTITDKKIKSPKISKSGKKVKITTTANANIKTVVKKGSKVMYTKTGKTDKKGVATITFPKDLKGMSVSVTVTKKGYPTKVKNI